MAAYVVGGFGLTPWGGSASPRLRGFGDGKMLPRYRAVGWVSPNSFGMCNDFVAIEAAQLGGGRHRAAGCCGARWSLGLEGGGD